MRKKRIFLAMLLLSVGIIIFNPTIEVGAQGQNFVCTSNEGTLTVPGGTVTISSSAFSGPNGTHYKVHIVPNLSSEYTFKTTKITHINMYNTSVDFQILKNNVVVYSFTFSSHRNSGRCFWTDIDPFYVTLDE